jgi:translocation and assembly module TamB
MRRWLRHIGRGAGVLLGVPALLLVLLFLFADTGIGRWAITHIVWLASDVNIDDMGGSFPDTVTAGRVEVSDRNGVWLRLDNVSVDWKPWGWFSDNIHVAKAHVGHATMLRLPVANNPNARPDTLRFDVDSLVIDRADFDKALTTRPISIALRAKGHWTNDADAHWTLSARQFGGSGTYQSTGKINATQFNATLNANEDKHGLIQSLVGLPDLGATTIAARVWGPRAAENIDATVNAGPAKARAWGGIDLTRRTAALDVSLNAPAMKPRPDLSWDSLAFDGHVRGSFDAPQASGHLSVQGLAAAGGGARAIAGELSSAGGIVHFNGAADGVRIPGREPYVLASAPVKFAITERTVNRVPVATLTAEHPLVTLRGRVAFDAHTIADGNVALARMAPFAGLAGIDVDGRAHLEAHADMTKDGGTFSADGVLDGSGSALFSRLLARGSRVAVNLRTDATGFTLDKAHIAGPALTLDATGGQKADTLDITYRAEVHDASRLADTLRGRFALAGRLRGPAKAFSATATGTGTLATKGFATGPVTLSADLTGLPDRIGGTAQIRGTLDAAPLNINAAFTPRGSGTQLAVRAFDWRSIHATGEFGLSRGFRLQSGHTTYHIGSLGDVALLTGQSMKGAVHGSAELYPLHSLEGARPARAAGEDLVAKVDATANGFGVPGFTAQTLTAQGRIIDPFGRGDAALAVKASGISTAGVTGNAQGTANGPLKALKVALHGDLKQGADELPVVAEATLDIDAKKGTLARLETTWRGAPFRLSAPARIDFAKGFAVDEANIVSDSAQIRIAGRLSPNLAADVSLANATPELARLFVPSLDAEGSLSGNAKLTGSLEAPGGGFTLQARNFRMRGQASGLPPASIDASGTLHGNSTTLNARIDAGKSVHLTLAGTAPLSASGTFDLKANGSLDLAVTDPLLAANGRRLRGVANLDGRFTGSLDNPRASGSAILTGGEFDDFIQGVRVNDIAANIVAQGDTITIQKFEGRAGRGTISGSGTIALWATGTPLDLSVNLANAQPLSTDQFTAVLDARLKLTGKLSERLALAGSVRIARGEINIAESYPPQVAVLDVRRSGGCPTPLSTSGLPRHRAIAENGCKPKAPPPSLAVNLDLQVSAPSRIFVRGRGLDAEVSGNITVRGNSLSPAVTGAFTMRRGELSLAGQTLRFTSGRVSFDGQSLNGATDPSLDFAAETNSTNVTAKLAITGHASAPRIALSSTPNLPQDEVLANLLFKRSVSQLSPFELAALAQAFAQLGGLSGGFNPLTDIRKTLGLDRLAVGASASGSGATIEVGKNVSSNVYVAARQDTAGGTQALVQVDLTEHLKLQTTVTAVPSATPTTGSTPKTDQGTSLGLSYQLEY